MIAVYLSQQRKHNVISRRESEEPTDEVASLPISPLSF